MCQLKVAGKANLIYKHNLSRSVPWCSKVTVCINKIILNNIYSRDNGLRCQETMYLYYVGLAVCAWISPLLFIQLFFSFFIYFFCLPVPLFWETDSYKWELIKETFGQCSIVRIEDKNTPRLEMNHGCLHNRRLILSGQT